MWILIISFTQTKLFKMPFPNFSPFPTNFSSSMTSFPWLPSSLFGFLYLIAIFILLLFILYLYRVNIFNRRLDRPDCRELLKNVETEAPVFSYDEMDNERKCVICLCGIEEGEKCRRMNVCGHVFHKDCIDEWFMVEHHCPLCRNVVYGVEHDGNTMDSTSSITLDIDYYNFLGTIW